VKYKVGRGLGVDSRVQVSAVEKGSYDENIGAVFEDMASVSAVER
jgi:hypothetical protein